MPNQHQCNKNILQNERKIMRKSIIKKVFAKATLLITLITATLQKTRF